jgi:hypothetical protein
MKIINIPIAKVGIIDHKLIIDTSPNPICADNCLANVKSANTLHPYQVVDMNAIIKIVLSIV